MNHLQYEFGLVPVKIVKEDKAEYIQSLIDSREQESLDPFREFMMEEHIRNISKEIEEYKKSQEEDPINTNSAPTTTSDFVADVRRIVEEGLKNAYRSVNEITVYTYWQVGRRIVEEEQHGEKRAGYGTKLISTLSKVLSTEYAQGFSARDLRNYRQLYLCFNDLEIWYTRVPNLTWSHYRTLLSVTSDDARYWYAQEASREMWSVRTLARNVGSQYYHRLLQSPQKRDVIAEMKHLTAPLQDDVHSYLKDPVVAEFLQLPSNTDYTESELEKSIIKHLRAFLLELGRGFAFMFEQYHVKTDAGDFFIDLVFYNVVLKCYVLIEDSQGNPSGCRAVRYVCKDVRRLETYRRRQPYYRNPPLFRDKR